jgi:hypothetical protein
MQMKKNGFHAMNSWSEWPIFVDKNYLAQIICSTSTNEVMSKFQQ